MSGARVNSSQLDRELACRGWSASDLARAAGISAATVSAARRGQPVAPGTLRKMAIALVGMPPVPGVEDLLQRADR